MNDEKHQCEGITWDETWGEAQCSRNGTIIEGGEYWCWQHAPSKVAERSAKQHTEWGRRRALETAKYRLDRTLITIARAVLTIPQTCHLPDNVANAIREHKQAWAELEALRKDGT